MDHNPKSRGNHPGIIRFRGHDYVFGLSYQLHQTESDIHLERRSVCVAEFDYNADGTIPELAFWDEQTVQPLATVNPYSRVKAETIAWSEGVKTRKADGRGMVVTEIHPSDYIKVRNVDFGKGARQFTMSMASVYRDGNVELHLDSTDGPLVGLCPMGSTGGWEEWTQRQCDVTGAEGCHDRFLVFAGKGSHALGDIDWWQFIEK